MPLLDSPVPPTVDLVDARSHLSQAPQSLSATASLYDSIGRQRMRCDGNNDESSPVSQRSVMLGSPVNCDYHLPRFNDGDYYPTWLNARSEGENGHESGQIPPPGLEEAIELRGQKRQRSSSSSGHCERPKAIRPLGSASWRRAVMGAVGKVWDFCYSSAFRGFYAGGGQGCRFPTRQFHDNAMDDDDDDEVFHSSLKKTNFAGNDRERVAIMPGQYPEEDEIDKSWVIIADQDLSHDPSSITTRAVRRRKVSSPYLRRQYASPRVGRKSTVQPSTSSSSTSPTIKQMPSPGRRSTSSPITQRHAAQVQQRDREGDASLRRLNKQLRAMIKEGKEALGTQVEVEDLDDSD